MPYNDVQSVSNFETLLLAHVLFHFETRALHPVLQQ